SALQPRWTVACYLFLFLIITHDVNYYCRLSSSQPPVEPSECAGKHYRHDQDARPEDEHVLGLAQIETADTADEQVADSQIEKAPQDIDRRGRQPFPRRVRERTLEGMARNPIAEMRQGVREECAPEEVRHMVVPAHCCSLLAAKPMVAGLLWTPSLSAEKITLFGAWSPPPNHVMRPTHHIGGLTLPY